MQRRRHDAIKSIIRSVNRTIHCVAIKMPQIIKYICQWYRQIQFVAPSDVSRKPYVLTLSFISFLPDRRAPSWSSISISISDITISMSKVGSYVLIKMALRYFAHSSLISTAVKVGNLLRFSTAVAFELLCFETKQHI